MCEKLVTQLEYIKFNIPYYKNLKYFNFSLEGNELMISEIPIIKKEDIIHSLSDFISINSHDYIMPILEDYIQNKRVQETEREFKAQEFFFERTTGTNSVFYCIKSVEERMQLSYRLWKYRRENVSSKEFYFFDFIHNSNDSGYPFPFKKRKNEIQRMKKEIEFLKNKRYTWWHVNAMSLYSYESYIKENKIRFENLKFIENNGAFIFTEDKKYLQNLFDCKIVNNYGCREVWTIAYECKCGFLHISEDIYFELVDENNNIITESNKVGYVVISSLVLKTLPFIRYKNGDRATYIAGNCNCDKVSRRIAIIPDREMIAGTDLIGVKVFKNHIVQIKQQYESLDDVEINIIQVEILVFIINMSKKKENYKEIENAFVKIFLQDSFFNKYKFKFQYENKKYKGLFVSQLYQSDKLFTL